MFVIEYEPNRLFITGLPTHMYLVNEWENVKLIEDPNYANSYKTYAFPIPDFNVESFPFLAVCGSENLSIFNVKNLIHKPLIN